MHVDFTADAGRGEKWRLEYDRRFRAFAEWLEKKWIPEVAGIILCLAHTTSAK